MFSINFRAWKIWKSLLFIGIFFEGHKLKFILVKILIKKFNYSNNLH